MREAKYPRMLRVCYPVDKLLIPLGYKAETTRATETGRIYCRKYSTRPAKTAAWEVGDKTYQVTRIYIWRVDTIKIIKCADIYNAHGWLRRIKAVNFTAEEILALAEALQIWKENGNA